MIFSTSVVAPSGLTRFIRESTSFDDVPVHLLPALADDLDAQSGGFYHVIHDGNTIRLGQNFAHRMKSEGLGTWRQKFHGLNPVGVAAPLPGGTGQTFSLDEWLDFPAYLRSPAYETFWGPMGIHHVLLARIALSDTECFVLGFHRPASQRRFADADIARLAGLLPLLGSAFSRMQQAEQRFAVLTQREREIAADIAEGLANKHIARRRGVSVHTVENHLRSIYRKTGVDSRTKLALATGVDGSSAIPA